MAGKRRNKLSMARRIDMRQALMMVEMTSGVTGKRGVALMVAFVKWQYNQHQQRSGHRIFGAA